MNFNNIKQYSDYQSYQRIKRIKQQQCQRTWRTKKCRAKNYQDYLDRKDGFVCCTRRTPCAYTGILGKTTCLTSMANIVELSPGITGFDQTVMNGSLIPEIVWYGAANKEHSPIKIVSLEFKAAPPGEWILQLDGLDASGAIFDCIELLHKNRKIQFFLDKSDQYIGASPTFIGEPGEPGATAKFTWSSSNVAISPPGTVLTPGRWIFQISV